eukprot:1034657-Prorocentrum_minimum.AAC.4
MPKPCAPPPCGLDANPLDVAHTPLMLPTPPCELDANLLDVAHTPLMLPTPPCGLDANPLDVKPACSTPDDPAIDFGA